MRTETFAAASENLQSLMDHLHVEKAALILKPDGTPAAYLVDPETFEAAEAAVDRLRLMEALAVGEKDLAEGRVYTHAQVKAKLAKWLK